MDTCVSTGYAISALSHAEVISPSIGRGGSKEAYRDKYLRSLYDMVVQGKRTWYP